MAETFFHRKNVRTFNPSFSVLIYPGFVIPWKAIQPRSNIPQDLSSNETYRNINGPDKHYPSFRIGSVTTGKSICFLAKITDLRLIRINQIARLRVRQKAEAIESGRLGCDWLARPCGRTLCQCSHREYSSTSVCYKKGFRQSAEFLS